MTLTPPAVPLGINWKETLLKAAIWFFIVLIPNASYSIFMAGKLSSQLEAKIDFVGSTIRDHDTRLTKLETNMLDSGVKIGRLLERTDLLMARQGINPAPQSLVLPLPRADKIGSACPNRQSVSQDNVALRFPR